MATSGTAASLHDATTPVAPWWHTALVFLLLLSASISSAHFHALPRIPIAGLSPKLAGLVVTLFMEWLIVFVIWLGLRSRGVPLRHLVSARWQKPTSILKDLGWALAFLLVATPCLAAVSRVLHASYDAKAILPTNALELTLWLLLAATAGFCEELTFRGYFQRQFSAWSGNRVAGLALQGLVFGMAHGYQGWRMMTVIMIFGWMFGALALWRKSLAPGMLAHWIEDSAGGLLNFFAHH